MTSDTLAAMAREIVIRLNSAASEVGCFNVYEARDIARELASRLAGSVPEHNYMSHPCGAVVDGAICDNRVRGVGHCWRHRNCGLVTSGEGI